MPSSLIALFWAAVASWKSSCWPIGAGNTPLEWNEDTRLFEPMPVSTVFSNLELSVKTFIWSIWYNVFPVVYTVLFLCTLTGIMDEGKLRQARSFGATDALIDAARGRCAE
jgi:hypothetical protein